MDIKNILNSLGLDLTNPEAKRGAIEAIEAILASRDSSNSASIDMGMSGGGDPQDIEIDPDLLQPSVKQQPQGSTDDIEIEDEEGILDQIKHNESEDTFENNVDGNEDMTDGSTSENASETGDSSEASSDTSGEDTDNDEDGTETADSTETTGSADSTGSEREDSGESDREEDIPDDTAESESAVDSLEDPTDDLIDDDSVEGANDAETEDVEDAEDEGATATDENTSDENDGEIDFDEDDLIDDELKDTYEDEAIKAKQKARKIKRERTLQAAKATLDSARAKNTSGALIRELEKAIEALEALTEAVTKNINDISDEEFNLLVNRVFDAIEALGDSGLTYTSDKERELQAQEIKTDLSNIKTQQELSAEDVAKIRAENQAVQAREKENDKYKARAAGSFKGFQDFLNSLYRAIALQVHVEETQDDTWSAINRRYSGTSILQPGKRLNELPNKKIPIIDFYFDCSGSWSDRDLAVGRKAVNRLVEMEEEGQIKINIFYFSNSVFNDATSARMEGGTAGWNDIVKNIIATQATNVIIMTDSDMEDWWKPQDQPALSYTVPGYVWYLWRDGSNAPRLPRDLKGRGGTQQFSFSTGDA